MAIPRVFIGSSSNGLPVAKALKAYLKDDSIKVELWSEGLFGLTAETLGALLDNLSRSDFGVFVFTRDDPIERKERHQFAPRDNVIFELGLFMGRLGRERAIIVTDLDPELAIPTDLSGVTVETYRAAPRKASTASLKQAALTIQNHIRTYGSLNRTERELGALYRILNACTPQYPDVHNELLSQVTFRERELFKSVSDVLTFLEDLLRDYIQPLLQPPERALLRIYYAYSLYDGAIVRGKMEVSHCIDLDANERQIPAQFVIGISNPDRKSVV